MRQNGYTNKIINQELKKQRDIHNNDTSTLDNTPPSQPTLPEKKKYLGVPYIKGTNERIQRMLKPYNITLGNKASNTLQNILVKPKDKL